MGAGWKKPQTNRKQVNVIKYGYSVLNQRRALIHTLRIKIALILVIVELLDHPNREHKISRIYIVRNKPYVYRSIHTLLLMML